MTVKVVWQGNLMGGLGGGESLMFMCGEICFGVAFNRLCISYLDKGGRVKITDLDGVMC